MLTIKQIYELGIKMATAADLRGEALVKKRLKKLKEKYEKLSAEEKKEFDKERLTNPYSDSRIFAKDANKKIKKVLVGIDISGSEILLADKFGDVDLVISHHPLGKALAGLHEVIDLQVEVLAQCGVPIHIAENLLKLRISEVARSVSGANHYKTLNLAEILNIPVLCAHTFADNLVADYVSQLVKNKERTLETVEDVLNLLKNIPEYQKAIEQKAGPQLFAGSKDRYAGKIAITEMTGGTVGAKEMYEQLSRVGIGTLIGMHMQEEWKKEAEKHHINVIIAGHIASDSLGMNLFLDELEKRGIKIVPCGGLIRVARWKKKG